MRVDVGLAARSTGDVPVALTIGSFDGVHRGHRALLAELAKVAAGRGTARAVLSFDPHPRCVLDPVNCPPMLTDAHEKNHLLAAAGIDRHVILPFNRNVSHWSAEHFCDLLVEAFDVRALVLGHDFALGHRRQGDVGFLRAYGARHGFDVVQVAAHVEAGSAISSTRIRAELADGRVSAAARLLGRPYELSGVVEHGEMVGRRLGFPTANVAVAAQRCIPCTGVYATWVQTGGVWRMGATNVGYRPTFGGQRLTIEAFLLDFDGDLYDQSVRLAFVERLREERSYSRVEALVEQIRLDVEECRRVLGAAAPPGQDAGV